MQSFFKKNLYNFIIISICRRKTKKSVAIDYLLKIVYNIVMKKIVPIILLVLSILGTLFSAFTFVMALIAKNTNGFEVIPLILVTVVFLVMASIATFAIMMLGVVFRRDKLCRIASVISALGFAFAVLTWLFLYI